VRPYNKRTPAVDETRLWTSRASRQQRHRGEYKHAHITDISPEEIERRYQQRLAEIRWLRNQGAGF
jgi:hypothetical protein